MDNIPVHAKRIDWTEEQPDNAHSDGVGDNVGRKPDDKFEAEADEQARRGVVFSSKALDGRPGFNTLDVDRLDVAELHSSTPVSI